MRGYVAVTDFDWFSYLRRVGDLREANFWRPRDLRKFRAIGEGEPLIFKLHYPQNAVVGFGYLARFVVLEARRAWNEFGERNGAASFDEMRQRVQKYQPKTTHGIPVDRIGCIVLHQICFLNDDEWMEPPSDMKPQVVQGKTYDLSTTSGKAFWATLRARGARKS